MDIDAIEEAIEKCVEHYYGGVYGVYIAKKARKQLAALVGRVNELEHDFMHCKCVQIKDLTDSIAALEKERDELKAILGKSLSSGVISIDGVNLVEENERMKKERDELRKCHEAEIGVCYQYCEDIDRARREGYELAMKYGYKYPYGASEVITYDEAIAAQQKDKGEA